MIEKIIEYSAKNKFIVFLSVSFLIVWSIWALKNTPLDAIPDLSDVQVIVFTEWKGRSPDLVEDQITYPIVTAMIAAPKVRVVRGYSFFGLSFVYIIFDDGTDIYWARSRVLEYMSKITGQLPRGVTPTLGPDATGVGWVFEYALVDTTGKHDLAEIRTFQDWYLRYWIESVPGVAEVASVGGFVKQYQIDVDPNKLLAYNIPLKKVLMSVKNSNNDVGGRVFEMAGTEFFVRGRGYIKSIKDIENVVIGVDKNGTPVLVRDVATVHLGPDIRRGIAELNGEGEVVGGIVVMRFGENALNVINRVRKKLKEVESALPEGVKIVTTYDRSELIKRSIKTLYEKLIEEFIVVSLVCIVFLYHFRSALVAIIMLPIAIILSFIPMFYMKLTSNIMSLGGIAIAIGAMVDAAIIMIENAHKYMEHEGGKKDRFNIIVDAAKLVGRPLFFSLLVITVSFIPVFTLEAQEGRLFKPLAFTKTFAMFFASFLSIILVPPLMDIFIRGKITPENKNPVSRFLIKIYNPAVHLVLKFKWTTIIIAGMIFILSMPLFFRVGSEFMPPLMEGTILYMPTTLPGISTTEAVKLLQVQDKILKQFPEVETVFGKVGRARTSTDPAPMSMIETTIVLKPESEWRKGMTMDKLIDEMDRAMQFPGVTNAWTMPIKGRIDMLTTGIRTPVGIKIFGAKLDEIQSIGEHIEAVLKDVRGTRSVYAERVVGGYFLDFDIKREEAARYGLTVGDVEDIIESAIGGMSFTQTVEGRERFPVNLRYGRELRDDIPKLKRVLIATPAGAQIPLSQVADIKLTTGAPSIKDEDGMLTGWVYVDVVDRDIGSYVKEAKEVVNQKLIKTGIIKPGYYLKWSGQYEYMERARKRLLLVLPLTVLIVFVLLFFNKKSITEALFVLLAIPFSLVGAIWILYILNYDLSIAVWVGIIALLGVDAETGVVMLVYLDEAYERWNHEGRMRSLKDLEDSVVYGAVQRIRPKIMTVCAIIAGLLPIMWSHGTGADVMKRIAAPMIGGIVTSAIMELLLYPPIYTIWKWRSGVKLLSGAKNE